MSALRLTAHAKINLYLQVGPILASGYHELTTIIQNITLADEMTIESSGEISLVCDNQNLEGPENLVFRAAIALRDRFGVREGAKISLLKRIPVGAGLGGGSADAAAALIGLTRFWDLRPEPGQLADIAAGLGADVPFCLSGGTAVATGFGERVRPLPYIDLGPFLIAKPRTSLATAAVYRRYDTLQSKQAAAPEVMEQAIVSGDRARVVELLANDLEPAAESLLPSLAGLKKTALRAGAEAAMVSGSGSAVMIFPGPGPAPERLAESLLDEQVDMFVVRSAREGTEINYDH